MIRCFRPSRRVAGATIVLRQPLLSSRTPCDLNPLEMSRLEAYVSYGFERFGMD